jgi:hypothetical protein
MKTAQRVCLPILCVGLMLLINLGVKPVFGQGKGSITPPIELRDIRLEFALLDASGELYWGTPDPKTPNQIPAGAQKLKISAKVSNRPPGSQISVRAGLQELCPTPDVGKPFLTRLRHLTESDQEVEVKSATEEIAIELTVHCEDCVHAICGCECPGKDHLGEGPHVIIITVSDPPPAKNTLRAKSASFRMDIVSVCPQKCVKPINR